MFGRRPRISEAPFGAQIGAATSVADPLLPPDDPTPDPGRPVAKPKQAIVCEFCECSLTPSGDYVSLSVKAKALRAQEETITALNDQISDLTDERDQARRDLADAQAATAALEREKNSKKGFFSREINT
jgi:FtsZ-binding cell division protein ZapB